MSNASLFMRAKDVIARKYGENPGKMLIHTGVIGWILSSAAQVAAIIINDKIPKEQKMFLVPQEMADAAVNIASFYIITQSFKSVASKLVKTGKWLPGVVRDALDKSDVADKVGKKGFDVLKDGKLTTELADIYKKFDAGIDVIATTIGSILSCNIVTPIVRNEIAANRQKSGIARMNKDINMSSNVKLPTELNGYLGRPSMQTFQAAKPSVYTPSSSLKI